MNFEDIRKKHGIGTKDKDTTDKTTDKTAGKSLSYSDIARKHGISYDVDDKFISSFLSDTNTFMNAADDSSFKTWNTLDLGSRVDTMRGWLYHNKNNFDSETYKSLSDTVDNLAKLRDYYSQFETEEDYKRGSIGWLQEGAETNAETVAKRKEYYQGNEDRIAEIDEDLPWYAKTWLPNFVEDIFLSKDKEALRDEAEALEADNLKYDRTQGVTDKYYTPITEEFKQNAAYRDYSNATMEELEEVDNVVKTIKGKNLGYDYDGNMVDATGKIIYAADHPVVIAMRDNDLGWHSNSALKEKDVGYYDTLVQDKLGMYLSASKEDLDLAYERLLADNQYDTWAILLNEGVTHEWKELSEGEIDIYYNLLKTQGQAAAYQYLDDMETELTRRATEKRAEEISEAGLLEQIALNAASIPMNVLGGLAGLMGDAADAIKGEDYNPYSAAHSWSNDASAIRYDTAQDINKATGNVALPWVGTTFGDVYQSIMSFGDSVLASTIPGGSALLGTNAATMEMKDLYERGGSTEQILAGGFLAGAAEMFFESFSISELKMIKNMDYKAVKNWVDVFVRGTIMGGVEASEEMFTEIANTISDALVMGSQTDWVDFNTFAKNVVNAGIGGFISGGFGGSIAAMANKAQYDAKVTKHGQSIIDKSGQDGIDALKQLALEMYSDKGGLDAKRGIDIVSKVADKATAKNVGRLSDLMESTINKQNLTDVQKALVEKGLSKKEASLAAAYITNSNGLTDQQVADIEKNERLQSVIDEVLGDPNLNISDNGMKLSLARNGIQTKKTQTTASKASIQQAESSTVTENAPVEENATESEFEASEEGKTIVKETGKEVSIEEIVSNEGGNLMVKLDNGETVNARDLAYATAEEGLVYEMVANMGVNPNTAMALVKAYDPASGVKAQTYAIDIPLAYQYGKIGYKKGLERLNLTDEQSATAYVLGRDDAKASGRTWSDTSRKTPETNRSKAAEDGIIYDGFELNEDSLTDIQKASLAGIRTLAKMSPTLEIHLTESVVENGKKYVMVNGQKKLAPNGYFRNGNEIYIDINAGKGTMGAMLYTASHEVVHFIAENSFEDFQALADFLFEHYGENNVPVDELIQREINKLKKGYETAGKKLPSEPVLYMKAYEEVVAEAMSKMLADPTSYEKLAKLKSENLTLWEKIGEAIKRMLDKLKSLLGIYDGRTPDAMAAHYVEDFSAEVYNKLQDLYLKAFVNAEKNYQASIGSRNLEDFADAKNTEGESLFQYKAMEADEDTYREMLKKWGKMTDSQISNLFLTIDNALELIKDNLEALDYAWEANIDDRAFSPVKPNSDKLYQVSLDFSTLCRKRILQQTVQAQLQEALNKPLSREEGIAIRDALIAIQEEGRQIEVACALCYVESARMKSPEQIRKFMANKEQVIKEFFAGKSGGSMKEKLKKAEADARERLHKENPDGIKGKDGSTMLDPRTASLKAMPKKYADEIRSAKKKAKASYTPTAEEQRLIDVAKGMTVSDFTSPEGLENLAKNHRDLFDAYTSFVRNATKSKGIENDTWWRAGDSVQIGDVLIANMNRENGLRSQSWSDFQVIHILDYIAATIELATRNTKEQAYTKVPDFAELMGNTGVMINLSLIPTAKFNGKLEYDSVEGIDYKRSLELRDKYHATVGTICIGVDNVQIQMLLGDVTVDYVIPYHKSGMAAHIRKAMHIPTWTEYEAYQSEGNLSRADAEKQAKKYGVILLSESDPNYHKSTSFSEWFDIKEAQQIAKIENANPSDKAKQKKYGVMYGGYMAMQNAANNYLKLCAERGISPKFSHEKADFTAEDNYWKLLIDRKMVDNITGEVIEQQAIKPIFDEAEVMRILNDELERYPKVKEDQEYAIRKVTEAYLSGNLKGGMSAKDIAKIMQTPVDNVSNVNIYASAEGDTLYSMDDYSDEEYSNPVTIRDVEVLRSIGQKSINKFTSEDIKKAQKWAYKFYKELGVKSPFFRAWFGEWRAHDYSDIEVVDKKSDKRKDVINEDTKWKIQTSKKVHKETSHHSGSSEVNAVKYLPYIDDITQKAVLFDSVISGKDNPNSLMFHTMYAYTEVMGYPALLKLKVEELFYYNNESSGELTRDYILQNIEEESVSKRNRLSRSNHSNKDSSTISIADLYNLVKTYDKDFSPAPEVNKLMLERGRPKVFYHGTNEKFSVFDGNRTSKTTKRYAEGFYFTEERRVAEKWGNFRTKEKGGNPNVMEVFLDVKNPLIMTAKEYQRLGFDDKYRESVLQKLIADKNDGIIIYPEEERIPGVFADSYNYEAGDSVYHNADKYGITDKDYAWWLNRAVENPDFTAMQVAVFKPEQIKSATDNIGTFDKAEGDILYSIDDDIDYAPAFYSHMGKVIDEIKLEKMGTSSILNHLKNRGVKNEEIKWSGIEAFLEGKKSVTKAELQEFITGSQLQIEEQMSGRDIELRYDHSTDSYTVFDGNGDVIDTYSYESDLGGYKSENDDEVYEYASDIENEMRYIHGSDDAPRHSQYKLDGGSNYRELVFKMPDATYSNNAMRGHWGQEAEGVLAHARIQDMETSDGKKMLFVEEIQSDWHNEGREKGYTTKEYEDAVAVYDRLAEDYANKRRAFNKYVRSSDFRSDPDDVSKKKFDWLRRKMDDAEKRMQAAERDIDALKKKGMGDVPDAPFRTNYHEYVLKRLLRMAAEDGYDSLGWATADIQSERWSDDYAEGYRIEYDQDIPSFLKKYGKKWGANVGKTTVNGDTDVWSMDIPNSMKNSVLHEGQALFSDQSPDSVSTRSLLANALETTAQNDIERNKLEQYKSKIDLIESEYEKLTKLKAEIKELSFAKGKRDTARIKELQFQANQTANRINVYDRQLLNLESTTALKNVLQREKELARKKEAQKGKEALARYREKAAKTQRELMNRNTESRKKAIESRNKTEMKHKIQKVVGDLKALLLDPTKDKHVPIGLQKPVAEALDVINMDTMGADERIAKYNEMIHKSKDPDIIAELTKSRDRIALQGENLADKLNALKQAYAEIKNSDDPLVRDSHNEAIEDLIANTAKEVGNTSLRDMSYEQLEAVYDMYKAILATVRNANKMFKETKQETITDNSEAVKREVRAAGGHRDRVLKATKFLKKFGWNMLKPIYAMKLIGSDTLTRLYENVRKGEDTWAVDVNEAKDFFKETAKKYEYNTWDFEKPYTFTDSVGNSFTLTLEQIMSLYAYSKREQADKHLEVGGFIFDDAIEVKEKTKLGIPLTYEVNDANPYRLKKEDLGKIIDLLESQMPNVKGFVDEMQAYLSDVMGAKGNEVSLAMYDIKLYKEKYYFPLKTAKYFREFDPEKNGTPKIKNSGFSKKTVPQAGNPIILSNFMDVWANHVNDMSMYHAFVLPLEDFMRVYNYSSTAGGYDSVQQYIKNAYGSQANTYIETLMNDLNGGARTDPAADPMSKGISLFKKGKVFASASVVIQQPSAIARALAYIDTKYFIDKPEAAKHKETWAEVKKYAPVAIIKEMGYFDTNMGRSTVDWIKEEKNWRDKIDDIASKAPALADELAWCAIWKAVKREVASTTNLKVGSEEFLKKAGERFTEVVTKTQVYDSVLSRSAMMRSKDTGMKMATAFMAEPTTSINMVIDAIIEGKRGNKKFAKRVVGAVAASVILNSILVSLVYAARDDDEDETYLEKYLESLTAELMDGFNPITYIPFAKDIWSIAQGFDVERTDMSLVGDLWESIEGLFSNNKSGYEKVEGFAGSVASMLGLPLKNILRDVRGIYNLVTTLISGTPTTWTGVGEAVGGAVTDSIPLYSRIAPNDSKSDNLYDAIVSGDQKHIERVKGRFDGQSAINSAIRKALRENDPRIKEAATAIVNGEFKTYSDIINEIVGEGHFSKADIKSAIDSEVKSMTPKKETEPTESKEESIYEVEYIFREIMEGDIIMAHAMREDIIRTAVANGKDRNDAEASFNSSFTSYIKKHYDGGEITDYEAKNMLVGFAGKTEEKAASKVQYWDFEQQYPKYDLSESAVGDYYEYAAPVGISVELYYNYYKDKSKATGIDSDGDGRADTGTLKAEILAVIDSLPLTSAQKDALYLAEGWVESKLWQAPWH